jgi:hypothetical protein
MPVSVKVNGTVNSLVHKASNGISAATIPDVCKTPSPGGPVPLPYPNISQAATLCDGTTTVTADGGNMIAIKGSQFSVSNGDNPGVAGGVKSSTFMKESTWILYSFDVKMDGQNACRLTDKKFQNHENTVDMAGVLQSPVLVQLLGQELGDEICTAICDALDKQKKGELPSEQHPNLQSYIASKFSSGYPLYTPNKLNLFAEMTWEIPGEAGEDFVGVMSGSGRVLSNGNPAPGSWYTGMSRGQELGAGNTFRPDFTLLDDASKEANYGNVKSFVEVKIGPDTLTANQENAKSKVPEDKWHEMKDSDCECSS